MILTQDHVHMTYMDGIARCAVHHWVGSFYSPRETPSHRHPKHVLKINILNYVCIYAFSNIEPSWCTPGATGGTEHL